VNDAEVIFPLDIVHEGLVIKPVGVLENEPGPQTSAGANPAPVTTTTMPTGPELGLSVIVGVVVVTVNVA
jgi:hypothetical protein